MKHKHNKMAIFDLFMSGAQRRNLGHYAGIVRLAQADGVVTDGEEILLKRMAKKLHISDRNVKRVFKHPEKFPINPPVSYDDRIERLFNLTRMIFADSESVEKEAAILIKVAVGLGFPTQDVEKITQSAIDLTMKETPLKEFSEKIKALGPV